MCIYTRVGSETESHPRGSLNHFHGAFLPSFLWPIILLYLGLSPYLVYLRFLLLVEFPCWFSSKESTSTVGDGSVPGFGSSPGEGNGNPLQYSCLGNPTDRGSWWATVHGVVNESDTTWRLSNNTQPIRSIFKCIKRMAHHCFRALCNQVHVKSGLRKKFSHKVYG